MESVNQISEGCLAARKQCVLFDHPNRGVLEVRGTDRVQFLHNVLSNDIKSLSPGKGIPACLLNAQAKIIANLNVLCFENFFWLALDYILKDKLLDALAKLIIMEQVELVDRSDELKLISIHGPKAKELVKTLLSCFANPIDISPSPSPLPLKGGEDKGEGVKKEPLRQLLDHIHVTFSNALITVIRINLTGEIGYGLLIPKDHSDIVGSFLKESGEPLGLVQIQASTLETLRIEAGIPRYGIDFDESNIPLESRLDQTVSFSKGCFPGQEILARLDSRRGVSKKLIGLELEGEVIPKKGDRIMQNNAEVGHITSSAFSPFLKKTIAMGYLKKEFWTVGKPVVIEIEGARISGRVASPPFYSDRTIR